jgi:hypothetical protein
LTDKKIGPRLVRRKEIDGAGDARGERDGNGLAINAQDTDDAAPGDDFGRVGPALAAQIGHYSGSGSWLSRHVTSSIDRVPHPS